MEEAGITNDGGDGRKRTAAGCLVTVEEEEAHAPGNPEEAESGSQSSSSEPVGERSSRDALARGLSSLLGSIIQEFDLRAGQTMSSQDELSSSIDRLTQELDRLLEDAPLPFIMQHAARISSIRRRVASMNTILKSVQHRVDNIDRILSVGLPSQPANVNVKTPAEGA
ncbi:hypothetical protein MLD38_002314 [Melastoma candidum]|uniref:Uncharacterized protein n=1 Tax=Melastoma candidum TaxID=119954 RepID=A0ACB9SI16_9MYRT|nr:hypothetical protein MLD38_002314 [Melastoma candidum]